MLPTLRLANNGHGSIRKQDGRAGGPNEKGVEDISDLMRTRRSASLDDPELEGISPSLRYDDFVCSVVDGACRRSMPGWRRGTLRRASSPTNRRCRVEFPTSGTPA
ncbi:hypothetical protein GCM10027569_57580 [Flindersiella endophytica]